MILIFNCKSNLSDEQTFNKQIRKNKAINLLNTISSRNEIKQSDPKLVEKPLSTKCEICKQTFSRFNGLGKHLDRVHPNQKPYSCDKCDQNFNQFKMFSKRHHKCLLLHVCKYCNKKFNSLSAFILHERTHTGEKPFSCKECGRAFTRDHHLNIHLRTHTGEQPYKCKMCNKNFAHKTSLKLHLRIHSGEKPFCCKECGKCGKFF